MSQLSAKMFIAAAKLEDLSEPHDILSRSSRLVPIREDEASRMLDWLIYETRSVLSKTSPIDIKYDPLHGKCSFSQCISAYALRDRGLNPMPFSAQSINGFHVGHAMLTVQIPLTDGPALFLIDPTFRQFCDPAQPLTEEGKPMPGYFLAQEPGGEKIIHALATDGYLKLTPEAAHQYLSSFCNGKPPFETPEASIAYMAAPIYDGAYEFFNYNMMKNQGFLIPPTPIPSKGM